MNQSLTTCYAFGEFHLEVVERRLLRDGATIPLTPKVFDTLLLLVENAGHLVEKDEFMKQLWPDTFVGEEVLARNISTLRKALGQTSDSQSLIATVPTRGYRFVARVQKLTSSEKEEIHAASAPPSVEQFEIDAEPRQEGRTGPLHSVGSVIARARRASVIHSLRRRTVLLGLVLAVGSLAGLVTFYLLSPPPAPRVRQTVQLTHSGQVEANARIVSDGARLYFVERRGGRYSLAQVPVEGGETTPIITPFQSTWLYDISPDHSRLLVGSSIGGEDEPTIWILPTSGGSPRRLGEAMAIDAAWSPDGQRIVYSTGSDLYLVKPDGSDSRKLVDAGGLATDPRWSPDGRVLRFTVWGPGTTVHSLWEISATGGNLHRLLAGWRESPTLWGDGELAGGWTPDGEYFVLRSARGGTSSIWAIREQWDALRRGSRDPLLLTTTDLYLRNILPGQNGRSVYFAGSKESRELVRFDAQMKQFVPYLSGVSARYVSFSRDGQWVAYVTVPGSLLWRSRVDGSERLQLTFSPMGASDPQWSPDGKQIAFSATAPGRPPGIFLISPHGGTPEVVTAGDAYAFQRPDWSSEGNSLLFTRTSPGPSGQGEQVAGYQVDLKTKKQSLFPGSEGFEDLVRSPDGRFVAAVAQDDERLVMYDSQSRRWTDLATGTGLFGLAWSADSRYVYSQDASGSFEQPIFRVRVSDRNVERIATSSQILRADVSHFNFLGLAPDGSVLATLTHSNSDIYALDVDFP
ncbi:MAG: winged helix-turn-helix domain-containing protein [Candidatus Acidiferrales bacterium]